MTTTNGNGSDTHAELRQARRAARLAKAKIELKHLERVQHLMESYGGGGDSWVPFWSDRLDRYRGGSGADPHVYALATAHDRRSGRNVPLYQTEFELAALRMQSRVLCATNPYAIGLCEALTSYVIGDGYQYSARMRRKQDPVEKELLDGVQRVLDEFLERNEWHGGEKPAMEPELFQRSIEDGEFALLHTKEEDGFLTARTGEPEQMTQPPDSMFADWSFGVHTPVNDVQKVLGYYLFWGQTSTDGRVYDPAEVTHFRRNSKRSMKRGLPDFVFDTHDALHSAGRLRRNMVVGAAIQACFAGIRQHEQTTQAQVESFQSLVETYTRTDYATGRDEHFQKHEPGMVDIPKGMEYVAPPTATNAGMHVQVLQAGLRGVGVRWNAPEWMASGDSSNNNYASSLVAESPFVKTCTRNQKVYGKAFLRTMWLAVEHWCETRGGIAGRSFEEVKLLVEIQAEPPTVEVRDRAQEAQVNGQYQQMGVKSLQTISQEQGLDYEQEQANIKEHKAANPPEQPGGMGGPGGAEPPDDGGPDGPGGVPGVDGGDLADLFGGGASGAADDGQPLGESASGEAIALESVSDGTLLVNMAEVAGITGEVYILESTGPWSLFEAGFSGVITDKRGRKRHYVNGKQVKGSDYDQAPAAGRKGAGKLQATGRGAAGQAKHNAALAAVKKAWANVTRLTPQEAADLVPHLQNLSVQHLNAIKAQLNVRLGGKLKQDIVNRISDYFAGDAGGKATDWRGATHQTDDHFRSARRDYTQALRDKQSGDPARVAFATQTLADLKKYQALPQEPPAADKAKEPWEMTRAENGSMFAQSRQNVSVDKIKPRETKKDQSIVNDYANRWKKGSEPPPVTLLQSPDGTLEIDEGHHRYYAALKLGKKDIPALVTPVDDDGIPLTHKKTVEQALASGKPVPHEVLKDYPDLAKPAGGADLDRIAANRAGATSKPPVAPVKLQGRPQDAAHLAGADTALQKAKFTGKDSLGREWVNGELVAAKEEPAKTPEPAKVEEPPAAPTPLAAPPAPGAAASPAAAVAQLTGGQVGKAVKLTDLHALVGGDPQAFVDALDKLADAGAIQYTGDAGNSQFDAKDHAFMKAAGAQPKANGIGYDLPLQVMVQDPAKLAALTGGKAAEPPAEAKPTTPQPPEPGFTGTDTNGHHWVNGVQVAQPEEQPQAAAPAPQEEPTGVTPRMHDALRDTYKGMLRFKEYQDGAVEIPHLYDVMKQRAPSLTVPQFHAALQQLSKDRVIELHGKNEAHTVSPEDRAKAIAGGRDGASLYYYVVWDDKDLAGGKK